MARAAARVLLEGEREQGFLLVVRNDERQLRHDEASATGDVHGLAVSRQHGRERRQQIVEHAVQKLPFGAAKDLRFLLALGAA